MCACNGPKMGACNGSTSQDANFKPQAVSEENINQHDFWCMELILHGVNKIVFFGFIVKHLYN
jgi:hypothetical protein